MITTVNVQEIEEQEKMFKEKATAAGANELGINGAEAIEWRRVSDSGVLEAMLSHVDSLHTSHSHSSGKYLQILVRVKNDVIVRYFIRHT